MRDYGYILEAPNSRRLVDFQIKEGTGWKIAKFCGTAVIATFTYAMWAWIIAVLATQFVNP
jgi:hypothetical protein